jgi:hypothetical protein
MRRTSRKSPGRRIIARSFHGLLNLVFAWTSAESTHLVL